MEDCSVRDNFKPMSSKSKKRLESKKLKACAFLAVARMNENDRRLDSREKKVQAATSDSSSDESMDDEKSERQLKKHTNNKNISDSTTEKKTCSEKMSIDEEAKKLSSEELSKLKSELRQRQKAAMSKPKLYLCLHEMMKAEVADSVMDKSDESSSSHKMEPPPLYIMDLQSLLLYAIMGDKVSYKPRWCKLLRWMKISNILVVTVKGLSMTDFRANPQCFPQLKSLFDMSVEMMAPSQYGSSVLTELFNVPLSISQMNRSGLYKKEVSTKGTDEKRKDSALKTDAPNWKNSTPCSRVSLLLNVHQMMAEHYPLPVVSGKYTNYVHSKSKYDEVSENSPMYALDCEMVLTTARKHELARVSVVNEQYEQLYDALVKPPNRVVNYLTKYSGITADMLRNVKTTLKDVQRKLHKLLPPDTILIGQSLNSDLHALEMFHPYVIDTSVIFNISGLRSQKPGLKLLTSVFLGYDIQHRAEGHDSIEDSVASMKLVQLKLKNGIEFGDIVLSGPQSFQKTLSKSNTTENEAPKRKKTTANTSDGDENDDDTQGHKSKKARTDTDSSTESDQEQTNLSTNTNKQTAPSGERNCTQAEVERRQVFFKNHGTLMYHDFFDIAKEENVSGAIIQKQATVPTDVFQNAEKVPCQSDKEAVSKTTSLIQEKKMVFTTLQHFRENCDINSTEDQLQEAMTKIDKHIGKLHQSAPDKALMVVVFSGRVWDSECHNAACFLKIV